MSKQRFDGTGFSKEPFEDEERAQMRERAHFFDNHFVPIDEALEFQDSLRPLAPLAKIISGAKPLATAVVICGILGGAVAWAIKVGFFQ